MARGIIQFHQQDATGMLCQSGAKKPLAQALVVYGQSKLLPTPENAGMRTMLSFGFEKKKT